MATKLKTKTNEAPFPKLTFENIERVLAEYSAVFRFVAPRAHGVMVLEEMPAQMNATITPTRKPFTSLYDNPNTP